MTHTAILFDSTGTLADTFETERRAWNIAFAAFDLDWVWDRESFARMGRGAGGKGLVARYATDAGNDVDAAALARFQRQILETLLARGGMAARPGVAALLRTCRDNGVPVGLCDAAPLSQVDAVLAALAPAVRRADFDWIGAAVDVAPTSPASNPYGIALKRLGVEADGVLMIAGTGQGAQAAIAAGMQVLGFPLPAQAGHEFPASVQVVTCLDPLVAMGRTAVAAE